MPSKFKIQISNPCHEEWEGMQTNLNGKFCDSCQKTVTDFTRFTDAALNIGLMKIREVAVGDLNLSSLIVILVKKISHFLKFLSQV